MNNLDFSDIRKLFQIPDDYIKYRKDLERLAISALETIDIKIHEILGDSLIEVINTCGDSQYNEETDLILYIFIRNNQKYIFSIGTDARYELGDLGDETPCPLFNICISEIRIEDEYEEYYPLIATNFSVDNINIKFSCDDRNTIWSNVSDSKDLNIPDDKLKSEFSGIIDEIENSLKELMENENT